MIIIWGREGRRLLWCWMIHLRLSWIQLKLLHVLSLCSPVSAMLAVWAILVCVFPMLIASLCKKQEHDCDGSCNFNFNQADSDPDCQCKSLFWFLALRFLNVCHHIFIIIIIKIIALIMVPEHDHNLHSPDHHQRIMRSSWSSSSSQSWRLKGEGATQR